MNGNRRHFIGAAAGLAAAGIGLGWAKAQSTALSGLGLSSEGALPPLEGATAWLNSPPLTPGDLHGRVVVIQFWTYTCINWLRTLPYVQAWSEKYRAAGLVVVGVHTPEFSFEHNVQNVARAAESMGVTYPIAIDSNYAVWDAFANQYWPALYVADASGRVRYHHFGEGAYEESEQSIQEVLSESGARNIPPDLVSVTADGGSLAADWEDLQSPETYLSSTRTSNFSSMRGSGVLRAPEQLRLNHWALDGNWTQGSEAVILNEPDGRIVYQFHARDLNLVMGPATPGSSIPFRVLLDGTPPGSAHGLDIDDQGIGSLTDQRLYQLIRQAQPIAERRFEIEFMGSGAAGYDFTFG